MERGRVLAAYTAAWAQDNEEGIRRALADCWSESSTYVSPLTDVVRGVAGLTSLILDLPVMFPGATVGTTQQPDVHHDAARVSWRMESSSPIRTMGRDYGLSLDGVDFVQFDESGRILRITAFFGPEVPLTADGSDARPDTADGRRPRVIDLDDESVAVPVRAGRRSRQRQTVG